MATLGARYPVLTISFGTDGQVYKNRFVKLNTAKERNVEAISATGDTPLGVVRETADGRPRSDTLQGGKGTVEVAVDMMGIVIAEAGASVSRNDKVRVDNLGRVVPATQAANFVVGIALEGTTSPAGIVTTDGVVRGDLISILLLPGNPKQDSLP